MDEHVETNAAERRRWNDEYWTSVWPKREQLTSAVTDTLLTALKLVAGQRVLEIGSGGGTATIAAGRLVGDGAVVGADISAPLVAFAGRRVAAAGAGNVSFVVADVQQEDVPGGPFDAALSQFGVMFFDEPTVAFRNIRRQLVPGGPTGLCLLAGRGPQPVVRGTAPRPVRPAGSADRRGQEPDRAVQPQRPGPRPRDSGCGRMGRYRPF